MTQFKIMSTAADDGCQEKSAAGTKTSDQIRSRAPLDVKVPVIGIIGGPGSGKGTQCEKLVKKYSFTHISTGDLMREEVKAGTKIGKLAAKCMEEGRLVESSVVLDVLRAKIQKELPTSPGFILDGYPRSLDQAAAFEQSICPITAYIYLKVSDEAMLRRLVSRGKKSGRADDNEETAKNRIAIFYKQTQPIVSEYSGKLTSIVAEGSINEVHSVVDAAFSKLISNGSRNVV
ncbi:adenylate kinase isoenzyme 1 [Galendromus occidentalis]|uniref:Adenylate kinase isoenzyme 1 n=1 Tax=Galendromus occidentalis TaxID=34638 RepID=A0AAJ6QSH4_9ACAR|nr:adenylate kinase isoenzyme 1 [Galendromus occidentalis]